MLVPTAAQPRRQRRGQLSQLAGGQRIWQGALAVDRRSKPPAAAPPNGKRWRRALPASGDFRERFLVRGRSFAANGMSNTRLAIFAGYYPGRLNGALATGLREIRGHSDLETEGPIRRGGWGLGNRGANAPRSPERRDRKRLESNERLGRGQRKPSDEFEYCSQRLSGDIIAKEVSSMTEYESVLSAACRLPVADRLRLIDDLAAGAPDDQPPTLSDAWLAEIEQRSAELETGAAAPQPWTEVRKRLFQKAGIESAD